MNNIVTSGYVATQKMPQFSSDVAATAFASEPNFFGLAIFGVILVVSVALVGVVLYHANKK